MLFVYDLAESLGFSLVMIIFMIIATAFAKLSSKKAWIFYSIGAVLQLVSLSGNEELAKANGADTTLDWIVYFVLLLITAVIVIKRYNKHN